MDRGFISNIKNAITLHFDETKVLKKIHKSDKLMSILNLVREYDNDLLYDFLIKNMSKIDIGKIKYSNNYVTILDKNINRGINISFYPNFDNFEKISIIYNDNGLEKIKEVIFENNDIVFKEKNNGDNWSFKCEKKISNDDILYEKVIRTKKKDENNYDYISNTCYIMGIEVIMHECIERTKDGELYYQYNKYYKATISDKEKSVSNYIYDLIDNEKNEITYEEYERLNNRFNGVSNVINIRSFKNSK